MLEYTMLAEHPSSDLFQSFLLDELCTGSPSPFIVAGKAIGERQPKARTVFDRAPHVKSSF